MKIRTISDVDSLFTRLSGMYAKCRSDWAIDEALYYMDHYRDWPEAVPGEERIQVNKGVNTVDISHSILTLHPPKLTAQPITPSRRSDTAADRVEKFIAGAIYVNNIRKQQNQIAKAVFDQVLYGRGALFSGWDPELEGDDEEYSELPLLLKYVNHRNLYCLAGGHRRDIAQMYCCYRTAEDMSAEWGKTIMVGTDGGNRRKAEDDEELVYKDLWYYKGREVWHCVAAGETWLKKPTYMKYYQSLPYTEIIGRGTTSEDLHTQFLGVLFPLREAISMLERWLNLGTSVVMKFADPPILHSDKIQLDSLKPGATIPVSLGLNQSLRDMIHQVEPSQAAPDIYRFIRMAESMVTEGGFSRFAYGQVNPESGPVVQGMNANDRIRLNEFQTNAELAISVAIQKLLQCAYAFSRSDSKGANGKARKLQVFSEGERSAIALSPDDLRGWLVTATLSAKMPTDEARDVAIAANAKQAGLELSTYTVQQRWLGVDQPADEERRIMREEFMRDPALRQAALQTALQEKSQALLEKVLPGMDQP
ncbi:MAG: hypothetical protein DRQ02_01440, partial [Candidatus Latescibacterota bacterium]